MPLCLDEIVIWSRSFDEYINFLDLSESDLQKKILAVADGASSFNCEARQRGYNVTSLDPLYKFSQSEIKKQIIKSCEQIYPQIVKNKNDYIWSYFKSPDHLKKYRMDVMKNFLDDFIQAESMERYIAGEIQDLPFKKRSFDIAIVSNFLFLYSDRLDLNFHIESITNLLYVANEVRIFPLQGNLKNSPKYITPVINYFRRLGFSVRIKKVNYHFTKGANKVLIINKARYEERVRALPLDASISLYLSPS